MKAMIVALGLLAGTAGTVHAETISQDELLIAQAGSCFAVGQAEAQKQGGTLSSADEAIQNGQKVCRVVIVVPARNGARPKRLELILPNG